MRTYHAKSAVRNAMYSLGSATRTFSGSPHPHPREFLMENPSVVRPKRPSTCVQKGHATHTHTLAASSKYESS